MFNQENAFDKNSYKKIKLNPTSTINHRYEGKENVNYLNLINNDHDSIRLNSKESSIIFPIKTDLKLNLRNKAFIPKFKQFNPYSVYTDKIWEVNSPESIKAYEPDYSILLNKYPEFKLNNSLNLSEKKDTDEENKLDSSLISIHSTGAASRKSTDISFKAKFKTEKCKYWDLNRTCKYGENCAFAHGSNEIRQKIVSSSNYKTKKCKQFFENGFCPYGSRCQFLHRDEEKTQFSYGNLLRVIEEKGESKIDHSKRLKIFEKICSEKRPKKKNLEVSIYDEKSIYEH